VSYDGSPDIPLGLPDHLLADRDAFSPKGSDGPVFRLILLAPNRNIHMPVPENEVSALMKEVEQPIPSGGIWRQDLLGPIYMKSCMGRTQLTGLPFKPNLNAYWPIAFRDSDVNFGVVPVSHDPFPLPLPLQPHIGTLLYETLNGVPVVVYRAECDGIIYKEWTQNGTTFRSRFY
jgi:hypothetical protein